VKVGLVQVQQEEKTLRHDLGWSEKAEKAEKEKGALEETSVALSRSSSMAEQVRDLFP
jgi:hypothetical protein